MSGKPLLILVFFLAAAFAACMSAAAFAVSMAAAAFAVSMSGDVAADPLSDAGPSTIFDAAGRGDVDEIRRLLAADPALVNAATPIGRTPLHLAAAAGHTEAVKALLSLGANPAARRARGATPLHEASGKGHLAVVQALLDGGADPQSPDARGCTPLTWAIRGLRIPAVKLLQSRTGPLDIFSACALGDRPRVKALLRGNPALIRCADDQGLTPLHYAALGCEDPVRQERMIRLLLGRGADLYARESRKATPIMLAEVMGYGDTADFLRREMFRRQARIWGGAFGIAIVVGAVQFAVAKRHAARNRSRQPA